MMKPSHVILGAFAIQASLLFINFGFRCWPAAAAVFAVDSIYLCIDWYLWRWFDRNELRLQSVISGQTMRAILMAYALIEGLIIIFAPFIGMLLFHS